MIEYKSFIKAKPIWIKGMEKEVNYSALFMTTIYGKKEFLLKITGSSLYRVFLNNKLLCYGPARAAHNFYRVDEIKFKGNKKYNKLLIEVAGYNCNSFYTLNQPSFIIAEVSYNQIVVSSTGDNFIGRKYYEREQVVPRFSYQRSFIESYTFDKDYCDLINNFQQMELSVYENKNYIYRDVPYTDFRCARFKPVETGIFRKNTNCSFEKVRYLTDKSIVIFDYEKLKDNYFILLNQLSYYKDENNSFNQICTTNEYILYEYPFVLTGFISIDVTCLEDSIFLLIFDEIDFREKPIKKEEAINVNFKRNDSLNYIKYDCKKGNFKHSTFEAYSMRYIKILIIKGSLKVNKINLIKYENCSVNKFKYKSSDKKLNKIVKASINTFKQNAVDILTDCPSRERAGWLCDSYFSSIAEKLLTGNNQVEKNFLDNYCNCSVKNKLSDGIIPMCYPSEVANGEFIPNWMLFYILELYNYVNRTGDLDLKQKSYNTALNILKFFKKYENEYGLLENIPGWVFIEWSKANDINFICGVNYPSNILYCGALKYFGVLYNLDEYIKRSEELKKVIINRSFNGEFFHDNEIRENNKLVLTNNFSETCQYYALYFDIIDNKDFYNKMKNYFGPNRDDLVTYPYVYKSNAFIGNLLRSICLIKNNSISTFVNESKEYYYKMAILTGTLWEHSKYECSLNHGFASYVAKLIVYSTCGFDDVDEINKIVYLNNVPMLVEYDIIIPLKYGQIHLFSINNNHEFDCTGDYKIIRRNK